MIEVNWQPGGANGGNIQDVPADQNIFVAVQDKSFFPALLQVYRPLNSDKLLHVNGGIWPWERVGWWMSVHSFLITIPPDASEMTQDLCHICKRPKSGPGGPFCSYPHGMIPVKPVDPKNPKGFWEWELPK
jgi:hypothetical protein